MVFCNISLILLVHLFFTLGFFPQPLSITNNLLRTKPCLETSSGCQLSSRPSRNSFQCLAGTFSFSFPDLFPGLTSHCSFLRFTPLQSSSFQCPAASTLLPRWAFYMQFRPTAVPLLPAGCLAHRAQGPSLTAVRL